MKYLKIMALALGGLFLTACSNDDDFNTASGVTVEFESSDLTVSESAGNIKIPVKITGEANGPVKIHLKVESTGNSPALPFEERNGEWSGNFMVTSDYLNIPADEKVAYIDVKTIDDRDENENRTFSITIESAEGATIGTPSSIIVTLKDNDADPYGKIQGDWKFTFLDYDGLPASWNVQITGYEEGTPEYGNILTLVGLTGGSTYLDLYYEENEETGETTISMNLPEPIGYYNSANYIWVLSTAMNGNPTTASDLITGVYDKETQTITFNPKKKIWFYVAAPDFSSALGVLETATEFKLSR